MQLATYARSHIRTTSEYRNSVRVEVTVVVVVRCVLVHARARALGRTDGELPHVFFTYANVRV